jgi:PAS domain S-box-containing protein
MRKKQPRPAESALDALLNSANTKAFFDTIGDYVTILDTHHTVIFQNLALRERIGDHVGEQCHRAYHQRESICEACPATMTLGDGGRHVADRSVTTPRGVMHVEVATSPLLDAAGKIVAVVEIAQDMTLRVHAERDLRESRQVLENITHGIIDSIFLLSSDFRILWANDAAVANTGLSREELLATSCHAATHHLEHPCAQPDTPCPVNRLLATGVPVTVEHVHHDQSGGRQTVEVTAYPIRNAAGAITEFVHITRDITQRKTLEEEREKLILELQEALAKVKQLTGLLPICASCKKIRDDTGYWNQIEVYIRDHSDANFTHGLCPECVQKFFEDSGETKNPDVPPGA